MGVFLQHASLPFRTGVGARRLTDGAFRLLERKAPGSAGPCLRAHDAFAFCERRLSLSATIADRSSAGRISKGPTFTPGCFEINWMAWFRSLASSTRIPPNCSFVSAYGPSVTDTLPFFHFTVAALRGLWSGSPPAKCPPLRNTSSYAKHSSL